MQKKVAFHTLGCKLNFSETSTIARMFEEKGFKRVNFGETADINIINTCSVTELAEKKCRQAISKVVKTSPAGFVAVIGCYSQLQPQRIAQIEGVNLVLGTNEKFKIFDYIDQLHYKTNEAVEIHCTNIEAVEGFDFAFSSGDRTRSFLKIQDGCDYRCTYCTIPKARGRSRNQGIDKVLQQIKTIAENNCKEIILTGVNIGDFGKTSKESFYELLKQIDSQSTINRVRISSVEPDLLSDSIIELVANSKILLPHFHIPLQSGSNRILALMSRRYKRELFEDRVRRIKQLLPQAFIGVDVITGFPSETESDFQETYDFLERCEVSFIHVFSFSVRSGTKACDIEPKVAFAEIESRSRKLHILSDNKHKEFYEQNCGFDEEVLFEGKAEKEMISGFTRNYLRVKSPYNADLVNTIRKVQLNKLMPDNRFEVNFD